MWLQSRNQIVFSTSNMVRLDPSALLIRTFWLSSSVLEEPTTVAAGEISKCQPCRLHTFGIQTYHSPMKSVFDIAYLRKHSRGLWHYREWRGSHSQAYICSSGIASVSETWCTSGQQWDETIVSGHRKREAIKWYLPPPWHFLKRNISRDFVDVSKRSRLTLSPIVNHHRHGPSTYHAQPRPDRTIATRTQKWHVER